VPGASHQLHQVFAWGTFCLKVYLCKVLFHQNDRDLIFLGLHVHIFREKKTQKHVSHARPELKLENYESVQHKVQFPGIKKRGQKFHFLGTLKGV